MVRDMRLTVVGGVADVEPAMWDRLETGPSPFCEHAFLAALENSGSVGEGTGWTPMFLLAHEGDELVGALPAWLKGHSYGEYIFDWAWADAAHRAGLRYYPKLVVGVPFTPATGRRILLAPGVGPEVGRLLASVLIDIAADLDVSSIHWLFVTEQERDLLEGVGYVPRLSVQYHWRNRGWERFDDFLDALRGKRRREIRRERRSVRDAGVHVSVLSGDAMEERHWRAVDRFYRSTSERKWGRPYLTPAFFEQIRGSFAHRVRFVAAERQGELVAGALAFVRDGTLYGRYWGCDEPVPQLHFETCFYSAVEHCIDEGIELFEAGAQGVHKVPRGFEPQRIHSAHHVRHRGLAAAVEAFCEHERQETEALIAELDTRSPFTEPGAPRPVGPRRLRGRLRPGRGDA
jgi:uncharacterized protein